MAKLFHANLGDYNIRINSIGAGLIDTDFATAVKSNEYQYQTALDCMVVKR